MASTDIKQAVKEKYAEIANRKGSCCGTSAEINYSTFNDNYKNLNGYIADADLNLGCGLPTESAGIKPGNTVVDLGSGAGNDVFIARAIVGDYGRVIGVDFTPSMIEKARKNNSKLGYSNVEFRLGEIENIPMENNSTDVVVSNCVLNLVPNKEKAFSEIYRILKPGGNFCISDIVLNGEIPANFKKSVEMYAGCVSGAVQKEEYITTIKKAGFENIEIKKTKIIILPDDLLKEYLSEKEIIEFKNANIGIFSITVVGYKK